MTRSAPRPDDTFSIGVLARDAGVSVQTLRHYEAIGLLAPTKRTAAGYRRYSAVDRAKLDVIKTLRELDVDLPTIRRMLRGATDLGQVMELRLRTLDHQIRVAQRRAAVIRVFLATPAQLDPVRLGKLNALAKLERVDQQRFVATELERRFSGIAKRGMSEAIREVAAIDLPADATREQVDAWLELAELVSDPAFLARYRSGKQSSSAKDRRMGAAEWRRETVAAFAPAMEAMREGVDPRSARARAIVKRWAASFARRQGCSAHEYATRLLSAAQCEQRRAETRFWELMRVLRPELAQWPGFVAHEWLVEAADAWIHDETHQNGRGSGRRRRRGDTLHQSA